MQNYKTYWRKHGSNCTMLGLVISFLTQHQEHNPQNKKLIKWALLKLKAVSFGEDTLKRMKRKTTDKEKNICKTCIWLRICIQNIQRCLKSQHKCKTLSQKMGNRSEQCPKENYRWQISAWKDSQHHSSSGKFKLKWQYDTTKHVLE